MFWVGTEEQGGYGMMNKHGNPWPSFYAKKLCAQHIRYGDWITFPTGGSGNGSVDVVVARGQGARRSAVIVHQQEEAASYDLAQLLPDVTGLRTVLKIDNSTNNQIMAVAYEGNIRFAGFGVAVVTTES
jgi:hypothetical protein